MNYEILLSILFDLLQSRRQTAAALAKKYSLSERTVYRYVKRLATALPLRVKRGRGGGILLADDFRLPVDFFTDEEYDALSDALTLAYASAPKEALLSARRKLTAAKKQNHAQTADLQSAEIHLLPTEGKEELLVRIRTALNGVRSKKMLLVRFEGKESAVEPHRLLVRGENWYLYGFCHRRRSFFSFPLASTEGIWLTKEKFRPRACPTLP